MKEHLKKNWWKILIWVIVFGVPIVLCFMTTSDLIALGGVIFAVIVLIAAVIKYPQSWCEYWREGWKYIKPRWNHGWILDVLKVLFMSLSCLSFGVIVPYCIEGRYGHKCRDLFVDSYVSLWTILIIVFTWSVINDAPHLAHIGVLVLFSYRLFETFQSWVSQYILGGIPKPWKSRNIRRSLVLVFVGYLQVIFLYALLVFILKDNFTFIREANCQSINYWLESLRYSFGNAATIGSDVAPKTSVGYALFTTQIMFTILFLTTAFNTIFTAVKQTKS